MVAAVESVSLGLEVESVSDAVPGPAEVISTVAAVVGTTEVIVGSVVLLVPASDSVSPAPLLQAVSRKMYKHFNR